MPWGDMRRRPSTHQLLLLLHLLLALVSDAVSLALAAP